MPLLVHRIPCLAIIVVRTIKGLSYGESTFHLEKEELHGFYLTGSLSCYREHISFRQKGDLLVVTKSMKDVMCLYSLGITAIAPNSENLFLTESQFEKLSKRFKKIVVFYDNDLPGIHNMNQIRKKFNIDCIFIPRSYGAKDISDFHAKYGREKTLNLIERAWKNTEEVKPKKKT